jgi:voltage-gated sodium channel
MRGIVHAAKVASESKPFNAVVMGAILLGGLLIGLETDPGIREKAGPVLHLLDRVVLAVFVIEIGIKLVAEGIRPWRYFANPWNCFDFGVTLVCLLPLNSQFAQVLRLARVARSLRLVTSLPRLQLIVGALLKSLPSFGWIVLLLGVVIYVYSVMGVFLFGETDPHRFGSLFKSVLTMFGILTLEGWLEVMDTQMLAGRMFAAPLFFVSFILSGTMIFLNLLVGVIVNSMSELPEGGNDVSKASQKSPLPSISPPGSEQDHVTLLAERLSRIEMTLAEISREIAKRDR